MKSMLLPLFLLAGTVSAATDIAPAPDADEDPIVHEIPREEIDVALGDINRQLTEARAVPYVENGKPAGYVIVPPAAKTKNRGKPLQILSGDVVTGPDRTEPASSLERDH